MIATGRIPADQIDASAQLLLELRATRFDISVADSLVLDMPMKLGLKLMADVGSNLLNAKWELRNDVVNKIDGVCLRATLVDFQSSHTRCIINRGILVAFNISAAFPFEYQELHVHLDMVARHLFVVALCMHLSHARATGKAVQTIAFEDAIDTSI